MKVQNESKIWKKALYAALVLGSLSGLVEASLFFGVGKSPARDNPADPRATNYQGYETSSREQKTTLLNAKELSEGVTRTAVFLNEGWKPSGYSISLDPNNFPANMETLTENRRIQFDLPDRGGVYSIFVRYRLADGSDFVTVTEAECAARPALNKNLATNAKPLAMVEGGSLAPTVVIKDDLGVSLATNINLKIFSWDS